MRQAHWPRTKITNQVNAENAEFISIIIAAHNTEDLIGRCLDSVLAAIDANCEVIVVDDHSTDGTRAVAAAYEEHDPRLTVIDSDQRGSEAARKAGVKYCQGDSVVFVDSDDTIPPDCHCRPAGLQPAGRRYRGGECDLSPP